MLTGLLESEPTTPLAAQEHLDPFAYLPGVRSRVEGLADGRAADDPNYVFHTQYVSVGQGMAHIRLSFAGLRARQGALHTRIHMVTNDDPPRLGLVTSDRTTFNRLMQHGELVVRFEALHSARYAVYGAVIGDTDATADALSIVLQRPDNTEDPRGLGMEARNSDHGRDSARASSKLISDELPQIEAPVSQIATEKQLAAPVSAAILGTLSRDAPADPLDRWAAVYTLQALAVYGVARPEARGLGFGAADSVVARHLATGGSQIVATSEDDAISHRAAADAPGLSRIRADHSDLGRSLINFDFLWHHDTGRLHGSGNNWIAGVEDTITALLPGGLAVFTTDFDTTVPMRRLDGAGPIRVGRAEFERAALILISRGHQVAQLKLAGAYRPLMHRDRSVAGLIVRRALLAS